MNAAGWEKQFSMFDRMMNKALSKHDWDEVEKLRQQKQRLLKEYDVWRINK